MYYSDEDTFTTNVLRKKVCVDISHFSVFSYCACAVASQVTETGQSRLHHSFPRYRIK